MQGVMDLASIPREFPQFGKSIKNVARQRGKVFGGSCEGDTCDCGCGPGSIGTQWGWGSDRIALSDDPEWRDSTQDPRIPIRSPDGSAWTLPSGVTPFGDGFWGNPSDSPDGKKGVRKSVSYRGVEVCDGNVYVHVCIDEAYLGGVNSNVPAASAQAVIDAVVARLEAGVRKYWNPVFCPCPDGMVGQGCYRKVRLIWHADCSPKKKPDIPLPKGKTPPKGWAQPKVSYEPLKIRPRIGSGASEPMGLTTPDVDLKIQADQPPLISDGAMVEVLAHELGHDLFGIYPAVDGWDKLGHNLGDVIDALMSANPRFGNAKLSVKEACRLVALTGGCGIDCCKPAVNLNMQKNDSKPSRSKSVVPSVTRWPKMSVVASADERGGNQWFAE